MPTYIMLANWTDQGAQKVKELPRRVDTAKKALADMGGEFKALYMTMGEYDLVDDVRSPGRRGRGAVHAAARHARNRAHPNLEGVSRGGVPGDRRLARLGR